MFSLKIPEGFPFNFKLSDDIYIHRRRKDGFNSDDDLIQFARKHNLQGNGSIETPFIIERTEGLPKELYFMNTYYYVLIRHINFEILELFKSSNIKIYDCPCRRFNLIESFNISLESTSLSRLFIWKAKRNHFTNCEIRSLSVDISRGNTFQNCKLPDDAPQKLAQKIITTSDLYFYGAMFVVSLIIAYWQINDADKYVFPGFMLLLWFILGFIVAGLLANTFRKIYFRLHPNKII